MVNQILINQKREADELIKESDEMVKSAEKTSSHIREELNKLKKKGKEIERKISLLL
ncbi:MAG: hypothetical protein Q7S74_04505 [Nanoarchaeota archaeon]|nr:hypothetical protein [Nanoarchaeota archaeon]